MPAGSLPVVLALGTALAFAISSVLVRVGVRESRPLVALVVTLTVNVVVLWAYALLRYDVVVDLWAWRYFVLAGLFAPVLGRLANYVGIQKVGVNLSVPIGNASPMVSVILAVALLGESLALFGAAGVVLVIAGGILLATVGRSGTTDVDARYLVFPVLGMLFFGGAQIVRKVGLELVPVPAVGAAVNMTTSWILAVAYVAATREFDLSRRSLRYFLPAGVASSVGVAMLYAALGIGDVVIVTPVLNTSPLFALGLTFLFAREGELFDWRVVVGTVAIVAGVAILSVV
jgi:uncharacterized membrane protein